MITPQVSTGNGSDRIKINLETLFDSQLNLSVYARFALIPSLPLPLPDT